MNFFHKLTFVLSYPIPKFVKTECHLHGQKIDKKVLGNGCHTPSTLPSSNFRVKTLGLIRKMFSWTDVPRMRLQLKILFGIKALLIHKKNLKKLLGVASSPGTGGLTYTIEQNKCELEVLTLSR